MDFRLLGPLEVAGDEGSLTLGGIKQRSLLAMLLLHANQVVSTDRLIDALWGASPPFTCGKSIQVYVSRLRKAIGDNRLVTHAPGYVLYVDPAELDLARFEQLVAEARRASPETASGKLREALALWRGPPLGDLAYEQFAQAEIARLEEMRLGRGRAARRGGPRARPPRRARGRAGDARRPPSAARAVQVPAHARSLPKRAPGGRARDVPSCAPGALRRAGPRAQRVAEGARGGDPAPGPGLAPAAIPSG